MHYHEQTKRHTLTHTHTHNKQNHPNADGERHTWPIASALPSMRQRGEQDMAG
jgi:hypothetical protein